MTRIIRRERCLQEKLGTGIHDNSPAERGGTPESVDTLGAFAYTSQDSIGKARMFLQPIAKEHPNRFSVVLFQGMLDLAAESLEEAEGRLTAAIALSQILFRHGTSVACVDWVRALS